MFLVGLILTERESRRDDAATVQEGCNSAIHSENKTHIKTAIWDFVLE